MRPSSPNAISFSARCRQHAECTPERTAVIVVDSDGAEASISYRELNEQVEGAAATLRSVGANSGSLVVVSLPTGQPHIIATLGAWRLGACVLPLNFQMPEIERTKVLEIAREWRPLITVASWREPGVPSVEPEALNATPRSSKAIADVTPCPGKVIGSGGSTGHPKLIADPKPWAHVPGQWGALTRAGLTASQTQLIVGALHHNIGFFLSHIGLFEGHTLILPKRFEAVQAVDLIEKHKVQFLALLPIMMQRIAKLPGLERRDFSSIEAMYHSGGFCPEWVKRTWLRLIAPARLWELYGGTEDVGVVMINGEEWLMRPGSVGRPYCSEVIILGEDGACLSAGEVGEIYIRSTVSAQKLCGEHWPLDPGFEYIGTARPVRNAGEFISIGDLGWLDADGYLYLADRRTDMIKSGGISIYPAEIEAALSEHPQVRDVVVIGLSDTEWGQRVHALIEPTTWPSPLSNEVLDAFCRQRLSAYKVPKSYEFQQLLPRDSSGKIRRAAMREKHSHERSRCVVPRPEP